MIVNRQRRVRVPVRALDEFVEEACRELRLPQQAFTICLVADDEMARWNSAYRGKKGPTDVLSFPVDGAPARDRSRTRPLRKASASASTLRRTAMSEPHPPASDDYLGDIAIAPSVAQQNARLYERTFGDEMCILILHGILHLMGYDHETDTGQMNRREKRLRRVLGLA